MSDFINNHPVLASLLIPLAAMIWKITIWAKKGYLITYPFKMRFYDKNPYSNMEGNPSKNKIIEGVHGLFDDTLFLGIELKIERKFEQINIRLVKKRYFSPRYFSWEFLKPVFWHWTDAHEKKSVHIEKITDLTIKDYPQNIGLHFVDKDDLREGRNGYYEPTFPCPKGGYLWYAVKLFINPDIDKWKGYISFQHLRGDSHRAYGRGKLIIKNTNLELK